ncbi:chitinase [Angustibacter sp. McL0619]|uniref:chitinase n=1 Tax=Angustibacter sp. McL0619 TaxID=3415676 RepID=UPI003CEEA309
MTRTDQDDDQDDNHDDNLDDNHGDVDDDAVAPRKLRHRRTAALGAAVVAVAVVPLLLRSAGGSGAGLEPAAKTARTHVSAGPNPPARSTAPAPTADLAAAAPYLYYSGNETPDVVAVMKATGIQAFTMSAMLAKNGCNPAWDGEDPIKGGWQERTIAAVRAAGGDVIVSFGGWEGSKLALVCGSARSLADAYESVIDAYQLRAIDLDVESTEFSDAGSRKRIAGALELIREEHPQTQLLVTMGTDLSGPETSLVTEVAAAGVAPDAWMLMPFDFAAGRVNLVQASARTAALLNKDLRAAYGYTEQDAYRHTGIVAMNGTTDTGEQLTVDGFTAIRDEAVRLGVSRLSYWATNRDRSCGGSSGFSLEAGSCSGLVQEDWAFARVAAGFSS